MSASMSIQEMLNKNKTYLLFCFHSSLLLLLLNLEVDPCTMTIACLQSTGFHRVTCCCRKRLLLLDHFDRKRDHQICPSYSMNYSSNWVHSKYCYSSCQISRRTSFGKCHGSDFYAQPPTSYQVQWPPQAPFACSSCPNFIKLLQLASPPVSQSTSHCIVAGSELEVVPSRPHPLCLHS